MPGSMRRLNRLARARRLSDFRDFSHADAAGSFAHA